jgi:prepilin-type processing-associated H-X9-DG protein
VYRQSRVGITLIELLVVIAIIGVLVGLLLPAVQRARETGRRTHCGNNLRQLALGLQIYESARRAYPTGASQFKPVTIEWAGASVWTEAGSTGSSARGHSWMVLILPYIEQASLFGQWDFGKSVLGNANVACRDISPFYCTTRRAAVRNSDLPMMFQGWQLGGTDYGGCAGSGNHFNDGGSTPPFEHEMKLWAPQYRGILIVGRPVASRAILDGLGNTIMLAELQRIWLRPNPSSLGAGSSQDGWAVGGAATHFTTDCFCGGTPEPDDGADSNPGGINNGMFESPGSDHPGGANIAMADGSVRFMSDSVAPAALKPLGSVAGGERGGVP